jgi:DinB family protein
MAVVVGPFVDRHDGPVANRETGSGQQPDRKTLDDLRRERGEGWQWARAQTDRCPQCGHHPAAMERDALGPLLVEQADEWRAFLTEADEGYLRAVPGPGIFSPIQYGAHVRDIERVYADRIVLMLEEDDPVFPQFNPDEAAWNGYNALDREELADDLEEQARRLAGILRELQPDDWNRTMTRDGGNDGVYQFTVAGLANYAVHESHHHLLDATGTIPPEGVPASTPDSEDAGRGS